MFRGLHGGLRIRQRRFGSNNLYSAWDTSVVRECDVLAGCLRQRPPAGAAGFPRLSGASSRELVNSFE